MPHNWTTAELLAAMRDLLVREDGDGLVIGSGVPRAWLPEGPLRANAYRIHGTGKGRRYFAASPPGGPQPDFHRLDAFQPFTLPGTEPDPTAIVAAAARALGCATPPPAVPSADADTWGRALMETLRRGGHAVDPASA